LRIGNVIHPNKDCGGILIPQDGIVLRVGSIDKFGVVQIIEPTNPETIVLKCNEYSGITITDEWLIKMGWQYLNGCTSGTLTKDAWTPRLDLDFIDGCIQIKSRYLDLDHYFKMPHIQYVHELQNLYYFLVGEELEIK